MSQKGATLIVAGLIALGLFVWLARKPMEEPGVTSSVEVTGIILGTSTSPYYDGQSPAGAVWVQTGVVIPSGSHFYIKSTAFRTDGTSYTKVSGRSLTSNAAQFVGIGLPRPGLEYYNLEIRDKEDGVILYNGNWYPGDIVGYY